jgi:DNA-binding FadR family transcriptional regulator
VANEIGAAILRGDYPVGANLPNEAELTLRFSVSRTVIREVMKTLAAKGLVVAKTKIGTRVSDRPNWNMFDSDVLAWRIRAGLDREFVKNMYEMRLAVEPTAAALAAERRSDRDVADLRAAIADMARTGHSNLTFYAADLAFHQIIARASGNPFMAALRPIIRASIDANLLTQPSPANNAAIQRAVVVAHAAVVDAIEARDSRAARRAMIEVVDDGMQDRGGDLQDLPT